MNWRHEIKLFFADAVVTALGGDLKHFGAWNSQTDNTDTEETLAPLGIFFEYSQVGDGLEYLQSRDVQQAERVPVIVTLHILFNSYSDEFQDRAYEHAYKITNAINGLKHPCVHGKFLKVSETEDSNHRAQYDYQISFGFELKEVTEVPDDNKSVDSNPEDPSGDPVTGRRLKREVDAKIINIGGS